MNHEPATKKEMMDLVLGDSYRRKGMLKYVLTKADEQLRDGVGFRVKNVAADNDWYVKDAYYVINVLVSMYMFFFFPPIENRSPFSSSVV